MLFYCWSIIYDAGPTINQHCFNVLAWSPNVALMLAHRLKRRAINKHLVSTKSASPSENKTFVQCSADVENVGPTLYKCYTNVSCMLGCYLPPTHCLP